MQKRKQMRKIVTGLLLVIAIAVTFNAGKVRASELGLVYGANGTITRAEWIHDLAVLFEMSVEEDNYPDEYYPDVTQDLEYYRDIMMAVEFGIIDVEAGENFCPNDPVDREFAAHTLNTCLGFQPEENTAYAFSDIEAVQYDDDAQVALNRAWFSTQGGEFMPTQKVTSVQAVSMLRDARNVWNSTEIDQNHENTYQFAEGILEVPSGTVVELDDSQETAKIRIQDCPVSVQAGSRFVIYVNEIPVGFSADKVSQENNELVIEAKALDVDEVFTYVDAEGSIGADLVSIEPAEGTKLTPIYEDSPRSAAKSRGSVGIKKQKFDKTVNLGQGAKLKISGSLSDLSLEWGCNSTESKLILKGLATVTCQANFNGNDNLQIPTSVNLCYVNIAGVGSFTISADVKLEGTVGCTYAANFTSGLQYGKHSGLRTVTSFRKSKFNFFAQASLKAGLTASLNASLPGVKGRVYAGIGAISKMAVDHYLDGTPATCIHFATYMYAEVGGKLEIKGKNPISVEKAIWNAQNSPVRSEQHYEDGVGVSRCTRNAEKYCSFWSSMKWGYACPSGSRGIWLDEAGESVPVFSYKLDDAKTYAIITGYTGNPRALMIPEQIDGYPVKEIGENACKQKNLSTVVIPSSVTKIGVRAFFGCENLESIAIPDTVESIGESAFENCRGLYSATLPDNKKYTEIRGSLFKNAVSLHTITIPEYITQIYNEAFLNTAIESLDFPENITFIGKCAFKGCSKLTHLVLPKYLETYGGGTFSECDALTSVMIPRTVTENDYYPGYHAFVDNELEHGMFYGCDSLTDVSFEKGTTKIAHNLFNGCTGLKSITIPDTVTQIGYHAFNRCTALEEINLPESLIKIDVMAFRQCTALKKIVIPDSVTHIGACCFIGCTELTEVKLPKGLERMNTWAFKGCTGLTEITIPKGLSEVEYYYDGQLTNVTESPFIGCSGLKNVILEDGTKKIAPNLFKYFSEMTSIVFPDTVTVVGNSSFLGTGLEKLDLPGNLHDIENSAFQNCDSLEKVEIPDRVERIGGGAFAFCDLLSEVKFPADCIRIEGSAFRETALKNMVLPDGLQKIEGDAFADCAYLESVTLPKNIKEVLNGAFARCRRLTSAHVACSVLGNQVFQGCTELSEVSIEDTVTQIGASAFKECGSLEKIHLSTGIAEIQPNTFEACSLLDNVVIPYGVGKIGDKAFAACTSLKNITILKNVSAIGNDVFSYPGRMTIWGVAGSYAQEYASNENIKFQPLSVAVASLSVPGQISLRESDRVHLPLTITPENATGDVAWSSSNERVAGVDQTGNVYGYEAGKCTITVTMGNVSSKCEVEVKGRVWGMDISGKTQMKPGETQKLICSFQNGSAAENEILWKGNDNFIAEVDVNGTVTALREGTVTISAKLKSDASVTAQIVITVSKEGGTSGTETPGTETPGTETPGTETPGKPGKPGAPGIKNPVSGNHGSITMPSKGHIFSVGNVSYSVLVKGKEVEYSYSNNKKNSSYMIPDTVRYSGHTYKVTKIGRFAFSYYKKMKKVTIGKNVKRIEKGAFNECKKLKTIVIKSKKLKFAGRWAIDGISPKAVIKVPKGKRKAYKKLFKSKTGFKKTMKIK